MRKEIGGYFELAEQDSYSSSLIDGVRLNTSRNALEFIIRSLTDCKHVYIPFYTCEAVIEPFRRLPHVGYSFYHINDKFEIVDNICLQDGDYLVANNYFGLKDSYISKLASKYGNQLIVDNAQALFAPTLPGIKAIYSARKFVGVADGGFAVGVDSGEVLKYEFDDTSKHDSHLYIRKCQGAEAGFKDYQANESKLDNQAIRRMSLKTTEILLHINYKKIIERRRSNYAYLHKALGKENRLTLPSINSFVCPMIYPFIGTQAGDLRSHLIRNKVFVARYWPNVLEWTNINELEHFFADALIPIPIDQRYTDEDLEIIVNLIHNLK